MRISRIRLRNFRAHDDTTIEWADGVNVLVGPNGAGKTNILEAIHVLCLSRSFLASSDRYVLQKGADFYEVEGTFLPDSAATEHSEATPAESSRPARSVRPVRVRVAYATGQGKKVFVNGAPLERVSDLVGRVPVVVFSPDDHRITSEGPDERRKMLDTIMCQWSPVYMDALIQYRRVLKQRNEILQMARRRNRAPDPTLLESWTEEFIRHAATIIGARLRFVDEFSDYLQAAYERVSDVTERPTMRYEPIKGLKAMSERTAEPETPAEPTEPAEPETPAEPAATPASTTEIADLFRQELERTASTERDRGSTQVGPHRDEILMKLGPLPVRRYASQGQHRTFGMALKLAQYDFLTDRTGEHPILLLDDVFDNLDPDRITAFLGVLASDVTGQSITTAARREIIVPYFDAEFGGRSCHVIRIKNGEMMDTESVRRDREPSEDSTIL